MTADPDLVATIPTEGDVLVMDNVCAGYGPYRALFDVSLRVPAGAYRRRRGRNRRQESEAP